MLSYWFFMAMCLCHWQRWKHWLKKEKKSKAICLNSTVFLTGSQFWYLRRQTLAQLTCKYSHFIQNTSRAKWPERNWAWRDRKSLSGLREAGCWLEEWLPVLFIKFDNNFLLVPLTWLIIKFKTKMNTEELFTLPSSKAPFWAYSALPDLKSFHLHLANLSRSLCRLLLPRYFKKRILTDEIRSECGIGP